MTLKEKILYHQIHPLKLAADIACEPVSLLLFWHHRLLLGLLAHFVPPITASFLLIRFGDLRKLSYSRAGAYLHRHMTRSVEGVRLAGDIVMAVGAWLHRPVYIAGGLAIIVLAWGWGLIRRSPA
jgi:hypothetical protein